MVTALPIVYSNSYDVDIGEHVFPADKYKKIKSALQEDFNLKETDFIEPVNYPEKDILSVHTREYVYNIKNGTLPFADEIRLELPYSRSLANAAFLACEGTIIASELAIKNTAGIHIGGGFHHAYADHGEGFCVFNDISVAASGISSQNRKVLIIDCDIHQGNGTASIFSGNNSVFTYSIHQDNNYPYKKEKSDLDQSLPDGTGGDYYNSVLKKDLEDILSYFIPDIVFYVAGADVYTGDLLGGLELTIDDLKSRDELVFSFTAARDIPTVVVLGGGYSKDPKDTVEIHVNTIGLFLAK